MIAILMVMFEKIKKLFMFKKKRSKDSVRPIKKITARKQNEL
mgnify:CR=1 FL=1